MSLDDQVALMHNYAAVVGVAFAADQMPYCPDGLSFQVPEFVHCEFVGYFNAVSAV